MVAALGSGNTFHPQDLGFLSSLKRECTEQNIGALTRESASDCNKNNNNTPWYGLIDEAEEPGAVLS